MWAQKLGMHPHVGKSCLGVRSAHLQCMAHAVVLSQSPSQVAVLKLRTQLLQNWQPFRDDASCVSAQSDLQSNQACELGFMAQSGHKGAQQS